MTEQAKRKESKEVTREEIDNLEAFVRKLEAKVARMSENWKTFCKSHLGSEANDGKIGGARLNFVTAIALVLVCAGIVAATQSYTSGDLAHWGKVKITSDGTYSTDGGIIASGAMTISNGVTVTQKLIVGCYTNSGGATNVGLLRVKGVLYADGGEQVTGTLNTDLIGGTTADLITVPQSQVIISNNATVGSLTSAAVRVTGTLTTKDAVVTNQLDALTTYTTNLTVYTTITVPGGSLAVSKLGTGGSYPANSGAAITNLNFAAGNLTGGCAVINDTTNRFYFEFTGTFGLSGVATQTWPFVAAVKPIYVGVRCIGDVCDTSTTNISYSYATSDTTNAIFFGPGAYQFGGGVWLKKP